MLKILHVQKPHHTNQQCCGSAERQLADQVICLLAAPLVAESQLQDANLSKSELDSALQ